MDKDPSSPSVATQPAPPPKHGGAAPLVQALGYVLAMGAGIGTVAVSVRDKFYDTVSHWPGLRNLKSERNAAINKVIEGVQDGSKPLDGEAFYKATRAIHDEHNVKHAEQLAKLGFGTEKGPIGYVHDTYKRWRELGKGKRGAILFSGAVSTGLTIGSFFLLNQNAYLRRELGDIQNSVNEQQQR